MLHPLRQDLDQHGQPLICASCGRRSDQESDFRWTWRREEFGFLTCLRVCTPSCGYSMVLDELRSTRALCQRLYGTIRSLRPSGHLEREATARALHYSNQIRTRVGRLEVGFGDLHQDLYLAEVARRRALPPAPPGEPPPVIVQSPPVSVQAERAFPKARLEERPPLDAPSSLPSVRPEGVLPSVIARPPP